MQHSTATALVTYTHMTAEPCESERNLDCGIGNENFLCHIANVKLPPTGPRSLHGHIDVGCYRQRQSIVFRKNGFTTREKDWLCFHVTPGES